MQRDFVLIHGGSHGAWCWEPLIGELAKLGVRGHALDLPGSGEDATPRQAVTFESCVAAVNDFIASRELDEVTLVGHSIAGGIVPDIVAASEARVGGVVFLAAYVLDAGERGIDLIPPERRAAFYEMAAASPDGSFFLPYEVARAHFFNDLSEAKARAYFDKLTPQPLAPLLGSATVAARTYASMSRYLVCRDDCHLPRELSSSLAAKLGVAPEEVAGGHDCMLAHPRELARLLTVRAA